MVQIISGELNKIVQCGQCSCTLSYTFSDIKERKYYDYAGDCNLVKYVVCPNCSKWVTVKGY